MFTTEIEMKSENSIKSVLGAMAKYGQRDAIVARACSVLHQICNNNEETTAMAIKADAIPTTISVLTMHASSAAVCASACAIIQILAKTPESVSCVVKSDGIPAIANILKKHSSSYGACEAACSTLRILTHNNNEVKSRIVKADVIPLVVSLDAPSEAV
ncbi:hypothetical protein Pelo_19524 [Pelomyxa schiedti]|nr:hypothetical protein Pelo_19524 [Pelomyxa schiedti]